MDTAAANELQETNVLLREIRELLRGLSIQESAAKPSETKPARKARETK